MTDAAVLVGVGAYRHMPPLPAALNNVTDLGLALAATFGEPAVLAVSDPESASAVLDPLAHAARSATDTLLFYFAGHGVRDLDDQLCLALPHTVDKKADAQRTALPVERAMAAVNASRARNRVVILDCCFSGRAMRAPSAYALHLLTATGQNEKALAPEGQRNTLFTGAMLDLLRNGIPGAGEWITVGDVYRWARGGAEDPMPHQRCVDDTSDLALGRNVTTEQPFGRRAELATRVGWKEPGRAARLFDGLVRDAAERVTAEELLSYRMSAAAWVGAAGDAVGALARWEAIGRHVSKNADVVANIAYWRERVA